MLGHNITEFINEEIAASVNGLKLISGQDIPADYTHDEFGSGLPHLPDAAVEASCTNEVSQIMKACFKAGVPVTVRGAGTGKAGGSVPLEGGLVLSLKGMNEIISFDEHSQTLQVQPGVLLQDIKAEAAKHGLSYPPDPGEQTATIGGNASTNASGPSALKYGKTLDYVVDATIVLAGGEIVKLSDRDEYKSILGSEGTLGIITELTLKLVKRPSKDVILLLPFADTESCINAALRLRTFEPSALEYLDTDIVEFSGNVTGNPVFPVETDGERVEATLMLQLEGDSDDELDKLMEAIAELSEELGCLDILVVDTPTLKREVWAAHDAFHSSMESAPSEGEINVNVPPESVAEFVRRAKAAAGEGIKAMAYAHVGSGGVHVHLVSQLPKDEFAGKFAVLAEAVCKACLELGGDAVGEYGVGYSKKPYLSEDKREKFKMMKAELDPKGILNPGKVAD